MNKGFKNLPSLFYKLLYDFRNMILRHKKWWCCFKRHEKCPLNKKVSPQWLISPNWSTQKHLPIITSSIFTNTKSSSQGNGVFELCSKDSFSLMTPPLWHLRWLNQKVLFNSSTSECQGGLAYVEANLDVLGLIFLRGIGCVLWFLVKQTLFQWSRYARRWDSPQNSAKLLRT